MAHYALGTHQLGSQALDIQERIIGDETRTQLLKAGLREGMAVWEYGCGNGASTLEIAKIIGPNGHVTAFDQSDAQLQRVKDKTKRLGHTNVTLRMIDLETWEPPTGVADFVFGRYILMHLQNPHRLLAKSYDTLLKDGGCALYAESSWKDTTFTGPFLEELNAFKQSVIALGQTKGADYNFGRKLKSAMECAGFKGVREECTTFTFSDKLFADIFFHSPARVGCTVSCKRLYKRECA